MSRYVDMLIIGYIGNPMQVGFYRSGKQITDQLQRPALGFLSSLFPTYCDLYYKGDLKALRKLVARFVLLFGGFGFIACSGLWFGAEWIVKIIFGDEFLPATSIIRILLISYIILTLMNPIYSLSVAVGKAGPALVSVAIATAVQVVTIIWLVPKIGVLGAAWANVAYIFIRAILLLPSIIKVLLYPEVPVKNGLKIEDS